LRRIEAVKTHFDPKEAGKATGTQAALGNYSNIISLNRLVEEDRGIQRDLLPGIVRWEMGTLPIELILIFMVAPVRS
jgi:hypothetical protein